VQPFPKPHLVVTCRAEILFVNSISHPLLFVFCPQDRPTEVLSLTQLQERWEQGDLGAEERIVEPVSKRQFPAVALAYGNYGESLGRIERSTRFN
jgi:hypothetical protein